MVGKPLDSTNGDDSGSAYIFEKDLNSGDWLETAKLLPSDGASDNYFGSSVDITNNYVIIGAIGNDNKKRKRCWCSLYI